MLVQLWEACTETLLAKVLEHIKKTTVREHLLSACFVVGWFARSVRAICGAKGLGAWTIARNGCFQHMLPSQRYQKWHSYVCQAGTTPVAVTRARACLPVVM